MALKHTTPVKFALWLMLWCAGFGTPLKASHEVGTARLSSPAATLNSVLFIQDNKFLSIASMANQSAWGFYDKTFKNTLTLGIDRYNTTALADFVATVTVQITSTSPQALGGTTSIVTRTLSVAYEGRNDHSASSPHPSIDQDVYSFSNGYKVTTKITGIAVSSSDAALAGGILPANVYLEAKTDAERYYPLAYTAPFTQPTDISIYYLPGSDEFEISWPRISGAEEYDLEWLWLDAGKNGYWQNNPQLDFRNNATRVRTSQQSYRISNVFEKGQVCFRLRGVGRASLSVNAWEKTAYTLWSSEDQTAILPTGLSPTATLYSNGGNNVFYITLDGLTQLQTPSPGFSVAPLIHENGKNWQYKATYAEEGKKKEVVSYFDGSLRSRQSVTKNNSDNNAIVGETYYDYNGRAAVQALPVPVADAKIKFYQYTVGGQTGFNFDESTHQSYGKAFFDEDPSGNSATCQVNIFGLDPAYGSSNYYSGMNMNQQFAQGYVPNAEKFPISQTVYTNDNTGRIAAQGGVGKTHQINSGHETKYMYGAPLQVELDRLFGSEVGYDQHYKKNMVIDANGQVSISYIDQEGRTIATALSGQGPSNLSNLKSGEGDVLYPSPTATNVINADLLNKVQATDYDTDLDNNIRSGDRLSFMKKILVPTAGTYTLTYTLDGTDFTYACLPTNTCYDCVYDLEIDVFDNCMHNPPGFTKVTRTLGNITPPTGPGGQPGSASTLDTQCNDVVHFSTSQLDYSGNDLFVDLDQGEYTIVKTLKINQAAMSYYLGEYLKSDCVKQPGDFDNISPDTSGCGLTCDECVAALGSKEAYIAANKGTADDWQQEYNICREPCEYVSLCESEYISMLADVSPGGQYGDWEDNQGNCNTSIHPVSVYNENNLLPKIKNFNLGYNVPDWRNPFFRLSPYHGNNPADFATEYRDEDGTPSKVYVTKYVSGTSVTYLPPVKSGVVPTPVNLANTGDGAQYYIKPQELANVADFIATWQNSWAKSLVFYHPEYPYYDWCLKNSTDTLTSRYSVTVGTGTNAVTADVTSSDSYDSLLISTDDIVTTGSTEFLKLCTPGTYDPYWTKNGNYYDQASPAALANGGYPVSALGTLCPQKTGTVYTALSTPWRFIYKSFDERYNHYQGTTISLPAFAALITTSCVIQYGQNSSAQLTCLAGVLNSLSPPTPFTATSLNTVGVETIMAYMPANLKNDYWNRFKSLYLSLKQEMQMEAAESYAMNGDYRGVNDGIGDPAFDQQAGLVPFTKYYMPSLATSSTDYQKQWFMPHQSANEPQYCTPFLHGHYKTKLKRFPNAKSALDLANQMPGGDPGAQIYASTHLCPNAFYLQNLLNAFAVDEKLSNSSINLSAEPLFNQDLYKEVAGGTIPSTYAPASWSGTYSGGALSVQMQVGSGPLFPLNLSFPSGSAFTFANTGTGSTYFFLRLYQLTPGVVSGGLSSFTIKADIADMSQLGLAAPVFTTVTLSGSTKIPLTGCSFTPPCEASSAAVALQQLMNAIAATGNMCSSSVSMSDPLVQPYFLNSFGTILGPGNWEWQVNGTLPHFIIKDVSAVPSSNTLTFTLSTTPCTSGSSHYFSQVSGNSSGVNVFSMQINTYTGSGSTLSTVPTALTGTVNLNGQPLRMGECSFDLGKCNTAEHHVREDMETFLYNANTRGRLQAGTTNFTSIFNFGTNLRDDLVNHVQTFNTTTQTTNPVYYYWKQNTTASSATLLTGNFMASSLSTVPVPDASACSFSLSVVPPNALPAGQSLLSSAYTLSNFTLAPTPMVNLANYDFSVTATFGSTPVILQGSSSCFGMRACDACVSPLAPPQFSNTDTLNTFPCTGGPSFTLSEQVGGATTPYTHIGNCAVPNRVRNLEYTTNNTVGFDDGSGTITTWNAYSGGNGTSLFFMHATGLEFAYTQTFNAQYSNCTGNSIKMKVHTKTGGSAQTYGLGNDFVVRINGTAISTGLVSSSSINSEWTQFQFSGFTLNPGANQFSITDLNSGSFFAIDDIVLHQDECPGDFIPCAENDTILPFPEVEYEDPCVQYALDAAENEGDELYNAYIDSVKNAFMQAYIDKCMGSAVETMRLKYNAGDYHFTLYYYDQAGNLVRTVPPEGVHVETNPANFTTIKAERAANTPYASKTYRTTHTLPTTYAYNSLNQLKRQETPDAGVSRFWYDLLGRLVASQNAKQAAASTSGSNIYSYTRYDELGRIAQVGEMTITQDLNSLSTNAVAALVASGGTSYPDAIALTKKEVTNTYYGDDASFTPLLAGVNFSSGSQDYLRSRVASVTIEDVDDGSATTYNHATHYSYDVHGNVKELIQENRDISAGFSSQRLKKLAYDYDLISGKVNRVAYQDGQKDMMAHRYEYDADNRITAVYSSKNNVIWERDAKYFYYLHGPLARVETGHDKVQGTDYAYTLHGWIKGVNSNVLKDANDIGHDGTGALTSSAGSGLVNKFNGRDVYGYSLTYFNNSTQKDYKGINGLSGTATDFMAAAPSVQSPDLYNGNIRQMASSYLDASSPGKTYGLKALLRNFTYDQLNRIETAGANDNLDAATNAWGTTSSASLYAESFAYDQNGNIKYAQRNGNQSGSYAMDNLTYHYYPNTNQLAYVTDAVVGDPYTTDISHQVSTTNYAYDAIGNLTGDNAEGISNIQWTVYGKIKKITFTNGKPNLYFKYDASGNRISKTADHHGTTPTNTATITYYVRDAQGNVMATYEQKPDVGGNATFGLAERHIYGSSRLGVDNSTVDFTSNVVTPLDITSLQRKLNYRSYELSNHLGNVMAVVSDRKIAVANTSPMTVLDEHFATSASISGWSTLGGYSSTISWASGGNIKLQTGVQNGNMALTLPNSGNVPYTLTFVNMTATGTSLKALLFDATSGTVVSSTSLTGGLNTISFNAPYSNLTFEIYESGVPVGTSIVEIDDMNLTVPTGGATQYFTGEVLSANDYYAFGATMPGRNFTSSNYRYGFNGKENDKESGTQDYGFRIYNPALGKFLSVDPLTKEYPELTPYQFAGNKPIWATDLDGLEPKYTNSGGYKVSGSDHLYNGHTSYKPIVRIATTHDKPDRGELLTNGIQNTVFGVLGTVGSGIYIAGSAGAGAAFGGAAMLTLSLGEVGVGMAQVVDAVAMKDNVNSNLHKAGSLPGLIAYQAGAEDKTAAIIDATSQVAAGGNPVKALYEAPKNMYNVAKTKNVAKILKEAAETYDTYNDNWNLIKSSADKLDDKIMPKQKPLYPMGPPLEKAASKDTKKPK